MFSLDKLMSAESFQQPIDIGNEDSVFLKSALHEMLRIRAVERQLAHGRMQGLIGGPVHLGVGQEAIAVGISKHLQKTDRVFGAHRSHAHMLALGSDARMLFAEVLGKDTGHSKGMGGSMHLWDSSVGFYGSVPIVAGTVSLAVGAAMAARLMQTNDIAVAYFGDGACEEGVVHESLNLASIQRDPVLFVVENNLFASHMHISIRQRMPSTARFAAANGIQYKIVDGNDVLAVSAAASELIAAARDGKGPGFLEAVTYRWYGHVDWREDVDVGVNRSQSDIDKWRAKDPVRRLKEGMFKAGIWSESEHHQLESQIADDVADAWTQALSDPFPNTEKLITRVYAV